MIDLHPASDRIARLVAGLEDDQLALPTPCGLATVGDVLDHVGMFASSFVKVARKELDEFTSTPPPAFDAANLETGWRVRLADDLDELADAWSIEEAWQGSTWVGGGHMPAAVAGVVALDELLIHGWDLSVATGQPYDPPTEEVEATIEFVSNFDAPRDGRLFGPIVDIPPDAPLFDRLLSLTGRDPKWRSAARGADGPRRGDTETSRVAGRVAPTTTRNDRSGGGDTDAIGPAPRARSRHSRPWELGHR